MENSCGNGWQHNYINENDETNLMAVLQTYF